MLETFNETAIASYVKTMIKENCQKLDEENLDEITIAKIEGKIEGYNEFLDQFKLGKQSCDED
ncbi:hypothetical protein FS935_15365 [Metabacillus litoralis]|uniref:Uncharacterized protein n=1 Tax=Metabacillus litoralis TaxID=152268 RepID=A0A5C6VXQ7_9BACI|nr:hypothetical protein [Metabacillus litoralis]TXC89743.1 hypothetical protein FS935_15365 [Metabacillus litoralis]